MASFSDYTGERPATSRGPIRVHTRRATADENRAPENRPPSAALRQAAWYSEPIRTCQEIVMPMRSRVIGGALAFALLTQLSACGTLFFPDRRGQIEGRIDPVVAGLNAIGILFYVIPGLIAFGIAFATGAIYLPEGEGYSVAPQTLQDAIGADGQLD